nr:zinc finger protein isoform X3 [Ciona intestinalis]|eukprot:XP_009861076.1 zinc finger protein isoform X3 [Ciona intestinalis]
MAQTLIAKRILSYINEMRMNKRFCDVEFITRCGKVFAAHSCVLTCVSPCFETWILNGNYDKETRVTKVLLPESVHASTFSVLLDLIYTCNVKVRKLNNCNQNSLDELTLNVNVELEETASELSLSFDENVLKNINMSSDKTSHESKNTESRQRKSIRLSDPSDDLLLESVEPDEVSLEFDVGSLHNEVTASASNEVQKLHNDGKQNVTAGKKVSCDICSRLFTNINGLERHKKRVHHGKTSPIQCSECKKLFKSKTKLSKHQLTPCLGKQKSQCYICKKTFASKYIMGLHLKIHTGDELFKCHVCNKKFPYKSSLTNHLILHNHQNYFLCSVCGKSFSQKVRAKEHESKHIGVKSSLSCSECNSKFTQKSALARHVSSVHNQHRPYVCETCGRCFARKNKLLEHTRTHTGEKPYVCSLCGSSYKANRSLKIHKQRRHGIKDLVVDQELSPKTATVTILSSPPGVVRSELTSIATLDLMSPQTLDVNKPCQTLKDNPHSLQGELNIGL